MAIVNSQSPETTAQTDDALATVQLQRRPRHTLDSHFHRPSNSGSRPRKGLSFGIKEKIKWYMHCRLSPRPIRHRKAHSGTRKRHCVRDPQQDTLEEDQAATFPRWLRAELHSLQVLLGTPSQAVRFTPIHLSQVCS